MDRHEAQPRKLRLHRETLQRLTTSQLAKAAGAGPTNGGPACNTFSEPSLCPTCLCT